MLTQLRLFYKVPRPFAESTANVGDPITHIYASVLAWIETVVGVAAARQYHHANRGQGFGSSWSHESRSRS
ncbi:TPA: hypothetical protein ACH3X2_002543 [Trebouxia sp. C0005]